jgi:cation:H+ antiporter
VPQLVIGLTVAAYGTSAPELAVSTEAAADHLTPIALGNVIGSCVANISLILGLTALLAPPRIDGYLIRREIPILLGSVIAVPITLADGIITRLEGGILVGCAVVFTIASLAVTGRAIADDDVLTQAPVERGSRIGALVVSGLGVLLLVVGSQLFIGGARAAAGQWGISDRMLGMTLVALGTSLPELMTAVVSSMRGQGAIAIGTLVGSNLLNVFLVLGTVAYLNPVRVGERMHVVDAVGLAVITLLGVAVMRGRRQITRTEGGVLVAAYVGFLVAASAL